MSIPHIIHQTGPTLKSKWHARWEEWSETWKQNYPDFEYKFWNDEDIDAFMKENYPDAYPLFSSYQHQVQRADMFRYYVLYHYGGIYADLDYECFQKFFDELPEGKVSIVESPFAAEEVQNSLMASPKSHPFWTHVFAELRPATDITFHEILDGTGPGVLRRAIQKACENEWYKLPRTRFSGIERGRQTDHPMVAIHHGTFWWQECPIADHAIMKPSFEKVYNQKDWGYKSGVGSLPDVCGPLITWFIKYIQDNSIETLCDTGCGYVQWIPKVLEETDVTYVGVDCVEAVLEDARSENPTLDLRCLDFYDVTKLPKADMYFVKDVIQHWPSSLIEAWLDNLLAYATDAHIVVCNCCNQEADFRSLCIGGFIPLSKDMNPLKKYDVDLLLTYSTKQVLRIKKKLT